MNEEDRRLGAVVLKAVAIVLVVIIVIFGLFVGICGLTFALR